MSNAELAKTVANAGGQMTPAAFELTVADWFKTNKRKMQTMAGDLQTAQQIVVALIQTVARTPKLMSCKPETVFGCLMNSAATNLFPGPMQECAYVPFQNKGTLEAVWMPMYGGLCKLAFNSGHVRGITTEVVYEADEFDYQLGSQPFVHHRPSLEEREHRGNRKAVYCSVETLHGRIVIVKGMSFIEGIKKRSKGAAFSDSPWSNGNPDDYDAMARKTVLKQVMKLVPKSPRMATAIELDNAVERPELAGQAPIFDAVEMAARMGIAPQEGAKPTQGAATGAAASSQRPAQQPPAQQALEHQEQQTLDLGKKPEPEAQPAQQQNSAPGTGQRTRSPS